MLGIGGVLPWMTFGIVAVALLFAVATYLRSGGWRDRDKNEITIKQVDQLARDSVERVEEAAKKDFAAVYQDMHTADGDVRNALNRLESEMRNSLREQGVEISQIKENVRHLPTQSDLVGLRDDVAELKASAAAQGARLSGANDLLIRMDRTLVRLEDHVLKVQT